MDSCTVKRSRKLNWAKAEVDELRNSYLEFRSVIDGRLCIGLTSFDKEQTWRKIQERVNAQSNVHRTVEEMKKKLSDMKSALKKRERERRYQSQKTGGAAPTMDEWDEKMIEAIGEVAIGGFCGVDTFTESVETEDALLDTYTQIALEICSSAMLIILKRQYKDQLPGGKYWDLEPGIVDQLSTVPTTNTISERDFAQLDVLMRTKPSASTTTYEFIVMWTNNKTSNWLNSLPADEKRYKITRS